MQGVGLGLVPLAMAAARDALPAPRVGPAIALLSVAAAAGVGAGYPISGFIAEHMGLSAAYWFGAIFSALALAALLPVVPRASETTDAPLDGRGAVLLSAGLVALLLAIGQGGAWGWTSPVILSLLAVAVVVIGVWVVVPVARAHAARRHPPAAPPRGADRQRVRVRAGRGDVPVPLVDDGVRRRSRRAPGSASAAPS